MLRLAVVITILTGAIVSAADPPLVATTPHLSPDDERRAFKLPPGFEAQLVAAEPDIQKPMNIAFDSRGRLWVTSTIEYPYPAKDRPGRDCIKILDDIGQDGRARKITTFAHGLNIPIGVLPYEDGAIVFSIPNIWRLRDTTGSGKADKQDVLLSGFGQRDTHGLINGLVRGMDGWLYACHGYANDSDVTAKDGSRVLMNSGNTFRFKPDGSRIEIVSRGQVNPFGQCMDSYGNHYTACCHSKPITQLMRGAVFTSFAKPHDGLGFGPDMISDYRGSTALCGLALYEAEQFPTEFRGRMFLGDVVNNCINIFDVNRLGASYSAQQWKDDFLTSSDPWFRPVDIKLGPDGALYVADFYNRIIGHYEVPLTHPGRDRNSGRIWRIVYKGSDGKSSPQSPLRTWPRPNAQQYLLTGPDKYAIRDLGHPNIAVRMLAMEELGRQARMETDAVSAMHSALNAAYVNGSPVQKVHALWMLERMGRPNSDAVLAAAKAKESLLRSHAMRILAERSRWTGAEKKAALSATDDPETLVRRLAVDALARHPSEESLRAVLDLRAQPGTVADPFLLHASRIALRDLLVAMPDARPVAKPAQLEFLVDAALGAPEVHSGNLIADSLERLSPLQRARLPEYLHHVGRYADPAKLTRAYSLIQARASKSDNRQTARFVQSLSRGAQERGVQIDSEFANWAASLGQSLLSSSDPADVAGAIEMFTALQHAPSFDKLAEIGNNRGRSDAIRLAALSALATIDATRSESVLAQRLADAGESLSVREKLAESLSGSKSSASRNTLLMALATSPTRLANSIAAALAGSRDGADSLLQAIASGKASPRLLLERSVRVKLDALKDARIGARIAQLTEGLPPADAAVAELLRRRAAAFSQSQADAVAGAAVYRQHCANCHQIGGKGTQIGPHLDGIGVRGLERLLEDTLDPNRNIDPAFRMTTVHLKTGQVLSGLVLREEGEVVVIADNQGREQRIEKSRIESREVSPLSPMPANWSDQIPEKDLFDLMAYLLTQRGKNN